MKALLLKTFVVAALMLAGTGSASAQFGNLMNKAKNAAKKEVKKQVNEVTEDVKSAVKEEAGATVNEQLGIEQPANEKSSEAQGSDDPLAGYTVTRTTTVTTTTTTPTTSSSSSSGSSSSNKG